MQYIHHCDIWYRISWNNANRTCVGQTMDLPRVNSFEDLTMLLDLHHLWKSYYHSQGPMEHLMIHIGTVGVIDINHGFSRPFKSGLACQVYRTQLATTEPLCLHHLCKTCYSCRGTKKLLMIHIGLVGVIHKPWNWYAI